MVSTGTRMLKQSQTTANVFVFSSIVAKVVCHDVGKISPKHKNKMIQMSARVWTRSRVFLTYNQDRSLAREALYVKYSL